MTATEGIARKSRAAWGADQCQAVFGPNDPEQSRPNPAQVRRTPVHTDGVLRAPSHGLPFLLLSLVTWIPLNVAGQQVPLRLGRRLLACIDERLGEALGGVSSRLALLS